MQRQAFKVTALYFEGYTFVFLFQIINKIFLIKMWYLLDYAFIFQP